MKKSITITMPENWQDIKLKDFLKLQSELENYKDDEEATTAVMLYHLCGLEPSMLQSISKQSYNELKAGLTQFLNQTEMPLQRFITIDGIEYGFEPNLSRIAYGAYADISKYDTVAIDDNWAKIMSILYRPVTKKKGELYQIETYDGKIESDKFLDITMDIHFGALFFFVHLSTDLLNSTLNSTMVMEKFPILQSILVKSGKLIQPSLNSPMEILRR